MSPSVRVGQLFLLGVPAAGMTSADAAIIRQQAPGGVFLTGRSNAGAAATARAVSAIQSAASAASGGIGSYVATDQEGGEVQVLSGPGMQTIPTATTQGQWSPGQLQSDATEWGHELRAAGVNVDLAPVADVLPDDIGTANKAIGTPRRSFGSDPDKVSTEVSAFIKGMTAAGVVSTVKHFPGLGRVISNTDFSSGVTDDQTTQDDPYFQPFQAAVDAGADWLLMSTAVYTKIDPTRPAAFSPTVVNNLVRGKLQFNGIVVSDEIGNASQVASIPVASRAVDFITAGGDIVLTSDPDTLPVMTNAILTTAERDEQFANLVSIAENRVLTEKATLGLLSCGS